VVGARVATHSCVSIKRYSTISLSLHVSQCVCPPTTANNQVMDGFCEAKICGSDEGGVGGAGNFFLGMLTLALLLAAGVGGYVCAFCCLRCFVCFVWFVLFVLFVLFVC
jgi:hypothetical protein